MKKFNKKGFTIVELVIVIAVIAILAAVLIPTFSGVIQKANESASLQTATSAMKTVLAQSQTATIADGTYFCIGDKDGVQYIYKYDNSKMETENLYKKDANDLTAKTVSGEETKLNTVIIPANDGIPSTDAKTLAILSEILGKTVAANNIVSVPTKGELENSKWKAIQELPTNAKYYINLDMDGADDVDTENSASGVRYIAVLTNVDFTEGTVVFTYSK